jgi:hypothetical protein
MCSDAWMEMLFVKKDERGSGKRQKNELTL